MQPRELNLLRSVTVTTWKFYAWVSLLTATVAWGTWAYVQQLRQGLVVTGMRDQVSWGLYITNFVFFIGISHVGALLSAILRFSGAEWRRPLTRMAEAITTSSLFIGALMPVIDMGRPDRLLNLFAHPRIQSPILWDIISVSTYFTGSTLFYWALMVPDVALLRDQYPNPAPWRKRLYKIVALNYQGAPEQHHALESAITAITLIILPLAVSVHTVVSWIFAMTLRPGWHSSIFGPYFVVGALYSGTASVILAMYVFRRVYRLQDYLRPLHFRNLGLVLLTLTMLYLYFNLNEYLTFGYKFPGTEKTLLNKLFTGEFSGDFWTVQLAGVVIPMLLLMAVLGLKRYQTILVPGVALSSVFVVLGAWVKRYVIIVPTLQSPYLPPQRMPADWSHYNPTWVEWAITAAAFAGFLLIYTLLAKLFPIVSIWETRQSELDAVKEPAPPAHWRPGLVVPVLLLVCIVLRPQPLRAATRPHGRQPVATTMSVEWSAVPAPSHASEADRGDASAPQRVYLYSGGLLKFLSGASQQQTDELPLSAIALTVTLRDASGAPLAFKPVEISMRSLMGTLSYGSRATLADGKLRMVISDRRRGVYPVKMRFAGDAEFSPISSQVNVDFGARPKPALPKVGVLITPYPTPEIGAPFVIFYGTIWIVFLYAFGYQILFRMRRFRPPGPASAYQGAAVPVPPLPLATLPPSPTPAPPASERSLSLGDGQNERGSAPPADTPSRR